MFCNESDREQRRQINKKYTPDVVEAMLIKYKASVGKVFFTSGEPTLNAHLRDYVKLAARLGYAEISLTTNGRLIAYKRYAADLLKSGLTEVIVSIHGHNARVHDSLTRTKGSFHQTVKGIENISDLRVKHRANLVLATCLNKRNVPHFGDIVKFFYHYNFSEIVFNVVQPGGKYMDKYFDLVMPRYSDVAKVIEGFYIENKQLFYRRNASTLRRIISIIDLPYCQSAVLTDYLGFGETRIIEDAAAEIGTYEQHQEIRVYDDNKHQKIKREQCSLCVFNSSCNGIYAEYVARRGWEEFLPILSGNSGST